MIFASTATAIYSLQPHLLIIIIIIIIFSPIRHLPSVGRRREREAKVKDRYS
jgi:hypothetical protein